MKRAIPLIVFFLAWSSAPAATMGFAWDQAERADWYVLCYKTAATDYAWDADALTCVKTWDQPPDCTSGVCKTTWVIDPAPDARLYFRVRAFTTGGAPGAPSNEIDAWFTDASDMNQSLQFDCANCQ